MPVAPTSTPPPSPPVERLANWSRRLTTLLLVVFCFEVGLFLLVFPWLEPWANNWVADALPGLSRLWGNGYFRGAVSGLGALNIYISLMELFGIRRAA